MESSQDLYQPLGPDEVRVLDILPGQLGSACESDVRIVQLRESPSFHALSYTWGTGSKEIPVHCGRHVVLVTLSLSQALQRLRKPDRVYTIWIDQICINQEDMHERMQQVALMGRIYTTAQTVDVWLGEASEEDEVGLAVEFIPRLVQVYDDPSDNADGTEEPNVIQRLGVLAVRSRAWEAVERLLERPYFRRVWIVQEASLGKVVDVHCGPHVVDWHSFALAAHCIASGTITNRDAHNVVELIQSLRRDIRARRERPLTQVLSQVYSLLCGNPLDRVYGVLGLVHENRPKKLVPNYELSVRDLFTKTARVCVETDQTLAVLSDVRSTKSISNLPSWVPDWTCSSTVQQSIGLRGRLCDRPVMDLGSRIYFLAREHTLVTIGSRLGYVGRIGSIMPVSHAEQDETWLEWQSLAQEHSSGQEKGYPQNFWRTVLADNSTLVKGTGDEVERLYEASDSLRIRNRNWGTGSDDHWEAPDEMSIVNSRSVRFTMLMAVSHGRRMYLTKGNEIGLGPPDMRENDEVCILHGSITPLVLRKEGTGGQYRLIGESYVLGVDYTETTATHGHAHVEYQII